MADRRRIEARDAGLERLSNLTQWVVAGGLVASGVVAATAAHAFSGHRATPPAPAGAAATSAVPGPATEDGGSPSLAATPATGTSDGYVQAPTYVPSTPRRWHTVSRGS